MRAADPDRVLGWVTEVLPYGLRLARFVAKGENCELKESEVAFVAAAHEVCIDVQHAIRELQPLQKPLQNESEATWVTFQVETKPGLREAEGAGRAKSVFLALCPSTAEGWKPASIVMSEEQVSAQSTQAPKICSVMIPAVAQWQRLLRAQPQKMDDAFRKLEHRTQEALAAANADELDQAVVQISAGICATESCSQFLRDVAGSVEQERLRPWLEKLVCLANLGLSGLKKDVERCRRRQNPCFLPALLLCRQLVWQRRKPLPPSWLELQKWVNLVLLRRGSKPWQCSAAGCDALAAGRVQQTDEFGPAGWRCCKHGARRCNVASCKRFARTVVRLQDCNGPPGRRCELHSGGTKWCIVEGCNRWPCGVRRRADKHGPPGYRCQLHGAGCSVPGCRNKAWGCVDQADGHGGAGRRCWQHGGKACGVSGCTRPPRRLVQTVDSFGPPGIRCDEHSYRCSKRLGPKTNSWRRPARPARPARRMRPSGPGPPEASPTASVCRISDGKGYRCHRPAKRGHTLCQHHWGLRQQWPCKQKAAGKMSLRGVLLVGAVVL